MFMGSGAVTFAMVDRCKYVIANDNDEEVFNLFIAVKEHKQELIEAVKMMPIHDKLFQYWKQHEEHDSTWQAARFLMLSNIGHLGVKSSPRFQADAPKESLLSGIEQAVMDIAKIQFMCCDFRNVLKRISWRDRKEQRIAYKESFVYADPPYLETSNNYQQGFTEQDTEDLFDILVNSGIRFALSEFDNPFVLNLAKAYNLHVTELGERRNLKNRRVEILVTNYEPVKRQLSVFDMLEQPVVNMN